MSSLTLPEVCTEEPCSKGVHNVFLQINFGCHGSQRLKYVQAVWSHFIFFYGSFFIVSLFCFVSISISVVLVNFARPSLLFTFCCDTPEMFYWLLEYIMAELKFLCNLAKPANESPPRTHRDRSRRLRGRTYGNTSLVLRIVRHVLVLRRVFKICVRAAGDLQWQEAYELMSAAYRRHYGWVVFTSSS